MTTLLHKPYLIHEVYGCPLSLIYGFQNGWNLFSNINYTLTITQILLFWECAYDKLCTLIFNESIELLIKHRLLFSEE